MMQVLLLIRPVAQSSSTVVRFPDRVKAIPCLLEPTSTSPRFVIFVSLHSRTLETHALNQASTVVLVTCLRPTRSQAPL